jgi:hypothetical protein
MDPIERVPDLCHGPVEPGHDKRIARSRRLPCCDALLGQTSGIAQVAACRLAITG